ncbi:hypothetical protein [Longimicrobium sp.]|jgi:hypothetical protein|uniref:hypothetical protein n=1 Tax=Longimicrobium sp. TaxID=2029185 RepID=UPI002EDAE284
MRLRAALLLLCAAALALPGRLCAQSTGQLQASLYLLEKPLSATGTRTLQFGVVVPGVAATVQPRTAQSGEWRLAGVQGKRFLDISFALPAALVSADGTTLPITFNGVYAGACEIYNGACDPTTYETWNPTTTLFPTAYRLLAERFRPGRVRYNTDQVSIYIGGRVTPAATQRPGVYTATVTVYAVPSKN